MKNIISASRRTDVPAFYYNWFQDCLKNKNVQVPNPMYHDKIYTYDLSPDKVHSIVLWSKNFKKVADNPMYLNDYNLYFQYTITNYNKITEPNVPTYEESIKTLEKLRNEYNANQFNMRFDPIMFSNDFEIDKNKSPIQNRLDSFKRLCEDLKQLDMNDCRVTTSYVSLYGHVGNRINKNIITLSKENKIKFFKDMVNIAKDYNRNIYMCSCPDLENIDGIKKGHCIDGELLDSIFNEKSSKAKITGQRKDCGCSKSIDIGRYDQKCYHNCIYCYATK